jgi:hypothetical protein
MQRWTPIAPNLWRPSNIASYSAMLLLHLSVSTVNYNRPAYLNFMPEGDFSIAATPAPKTPQALSQYTCYGVSMTVPLV